ncbi:hypothetical protein C9F11_08860 [Streptomyces sp. YIM 121038]|uniref:hypothetical protein n=1 Tax=Streptomyces sp. YIM 121038 TaxID=2136401 RepID=UPI0011106999|nr:hypothetical protein [Streptomyces sp. YIM 121038]QCX75461.1 hypothetical protein C9F11_08860 [Streptomyces sp. YIM 121038]
MITAYRPGSRGVRAWTPPARPTGKGVDWIAVERAADGDLDPALLGNEERRQTALVLIRRGMPRRFIAQRIGISEYWITKWGEAA